MQEEDGVAGRRRDIAHDGADGVMAETVRAVRRTRVSNGFIDWLVSWFSSSTYPSSLQPSMSV